MTTSALELVDVTKIFKKDREEMRAVDSVNLSVAKGEMVVFLGPSGCGKTTTLRMIAGFELPSSGRILMDGEDMTNVPVNRRGIGFVFQNYALFPHMNVFHNVAYGLKSRGEHDATIRQKVNEALSLVGLANTGNRYPNQLSGGEQQRVALARVLVMEPKLLLMDEPLSNLDAKLRVYMRNEIRRIQKQLGITCLYVTHDQAEALTMADRIMVMHKGRVEQVGTPYDLYAAPQSLFVADFIGQANILRVPVVEAGRESALIQLGEGPAMSVKVVSREVPKAGIQAALVVRPEHVQICTVEEAAGRPGIVIAVVAHAIFMGGHMEYYLDAGSLGKILVFQQFKPHMRRFEIGQRVGAIIDPELAFILVER